MPEPKREQQQEKKDSKSQFKRSLTRLKKGINPLQNMGLSKTFHEQFTSVESSMEECERAMHVLANDYVYQLEKFKLSKSSLEGLEALNNSEEIWENESSTLHRHQNIINEDSFLQKMRRQAICIFDQKIVEINERVGKHLKDEDIAFLLGILWSLDQSFKELGHPKTSKERLRLSSIAKALV